MPDTMNLCMPLGQCTNYMQDPNDSLASVEKAATFWSRREAKWQAEGESLQEPNPDFERKELGARKPEIRQEAPQAMASATRSPDQN